MRLRSGLVAAATVLAVLVPLSRTAAAAAPTPTLPSQGRPATASSIEGPAWSAANAVDGDATTRWSTDPVPGSWTPVWSDDFTGAAGTSPSGANWLLRTGTAYPGGAANWGTGEVETASASTANVALDGTGKLAITALRDGAGNWTSGRIETQRADFAAPAGGQLKLSAVLKQPDVANAAGYWPGFRATGAAYRGNYNNFPGVGETDIMTDVNGRSQLSNTLHCGTAPGGPCNEYDGRTSGFASCTGCQTGYHEYTEVIDRTRTDEEIRFYLDGAQTWVVHESQVGVSAWQAAVQHGFFLRFDLAIGGSLPNAVAGSTTPTAATTSGGTLSVDSVSVATSTGPAPTPMTDPPTPAGPSVVRVTGSQGNWQLTVNGAPWTVKGMTYGPPPDAADGYMRDLRAMGVNTIRTWAVDDANTPALLNRAAQQGIKVIVGHWLNQGADYVNDTAYKNSVKAEILARVNALKNNPGVLMWDLGNEVILTMQDHGLSAADVEARRVAYAKFVNELAEAIHAADPNHPVTSTDAWQVSGFSSAWDYYKAYAPSLDLLAINAYGGVAGVYQTWVNAGTDQAVHPDRGRPVRRVGGAQRRQRRADRAHRRAEARRLHRELERDRGPSRDRARRDRVPLRAGERLRRRVAQHLHRRLAPAGLLRAQAGLHRAVIGQHAAGHLEHDGEHAHRRAPRAAGSR